MEGQSYRSALVDVVYFAIVGVLGWHHSLSEPVLAALLGVYSAHRFGVAMGKQQAVVALSSPPRDGGQGGGGLTLRPPPSSSSTSDGAPPSVAHRSSELLDRLGWIG